MQDPRNLAERRVGATLNKKWELVRLIDVGGMAAVYEATHRNGRRVAVKVLLPAFAAEKDVRKRFLREGYVANRINHPGVVAILDDDQTDDGIVFLVMELLEGESLDQYLRRMGGTLRLAEVLAVADQTLDVLSAAHAQQIVHRDIKPGNLYLLRDGHVKVLDFGLARVRDGKSSLVPTGMGVVLGTYQYMPPEQARGKADRIDGRADIFAVGAVMFRTLTGRYVHRGDAAQDVLMAAMREHAPPLASVAPRIPACVCAVVDKALAFDMEERWADAASMQAAVREAFAEVRPNLDTLEDALAPAAGDAPALSSSDRAPMSAFGSYLVEASFGGTAGKAAEPRDDSRPPTVPERKA